MHGWMRTAANAVVRVRRCIIRARLRGRCASAIARRLVDGSLGATGAGGVGGWGYKSGEQTGQTHPRSGREVVDSLPRSHAAMSERLRCRNAHRAASLAAIDDVQHPARMHRKFDLNTPFQRASNLDACQDGC